MKRKNKYLFLIPAIGICLALGTNACKSSKETSRIALSGKSKNERLDLITGQAIRYETFSSSISCTIQIDKNTSKTGIDGQLKMIKDQVIQLSLKMPVLGTELFRLTLTPDKIIAIDRINKQYLLESTQRVREQVPFDFDFYSLQALLSNQLFIAGKNAIHPEDYELFRIHEDLYSVQIENTGTHNTGYAFTTNYTHRILNTQISKPEWNTRMSWIYAKFEPADNKELFPMNMKMELSFPDGTVTMNLTFKTVNINRTFSIDSNYPGKYRQVSLPEVIKLIKHLQ
jgi:hypothetical protein